MKTIQLLAILFLLGLTRLGLSANAADGNLLQKDTSKVAGGKVNFRTPEEIANRDNEWMNKDLKLSPAQLIKIEEINLKYANKMQALREQYQGNRQEMRSRRAELDGQKRTELASALSAEQIKKYDEILAERKQQMLNRQGNR